MRIIDVEQGTQEWLDARVGVLTASVMEMVMTPKAMKPSTQQKKLAFRMLAEEMLGRSLEDASTAFMQRGTELEAEARAWYELERGLKVERVGLCVRDDGLVGFSPDGLVGDDGGLELKCPSAAVHLGYVLEGPGDDYYCQVQSTLWISGRKWWDFLSYCPGLPPYLVRYIPDEKFIAALSATVSGFLQMLDDYRTTLGYVEVDEEEDAPF